LLKTTYVYVGGGANISISWGDNQQLSYQ